MNTTSLPKISLILGGAASGKSRFAEGLAEAPGARLRYIATAQVIDREMQEKVDKHRDRRGLLWNTVEAPLDVAGSLSAAEYNEIVLLDCATLWLTNHMIAENDLNREEDYLVHALQSCLAPVIVVSNEIGEGLVPESAFARQFREQQGQLNQRLAQEADLVVKVIAGLPLVLKGQLPA